MTSHLRLALLALALTATTLPLPAQEPATGTPEQTAPPAAPTERKPIRVSGGVMAGLCTHKVDPVTPPEVRSAGITGAVVLATTVGADGLVKDTKLISGPDVLRKPAVDAVTQWRYKPFLLNGQPTAVLTTVTVLFH